VPYRPQKGTRSIAIAKHGIPYYGILWNHILYASKMCVYLLMCVYVWKLGSSVYVWELGSSLELSNK
jgi:hypothetical protein